MGQRLKGQQEEETPTGYCFHFLHDMYCTLHANVQQCMDGCMDTKHNEILYLTAHSLRLKQHCLCVLELRTHTTCWILEGTKVASFQRIAAKNLSHTSSISNSSNLNHHSLFEQPAHIIFFTHRRTNVLNTYIGRYECPKFLRHIVSTHRRKYRCRLYVKCLTHFFPITII